MSVSEDVKKTALVSFTYDQRADQHGPPTRPTFLREPGQQPNCSCEYDLRVPTVWASAPGEDGRDSPAAFMTALRPSGAGAW